MRFVKSALLASTLLSAGTFSAQADVNVVTSIKPVHSLVAAVMKGVNEPSLIVDGASSPHTYALKPSQAAALQDADIVFWVGHELEAFLEKPLEAIANKAKTIELLDAHDLVKLEFREGGAFDDHAHEGGEDHSEHAHDEEGHDKKAKAEHDHDEHKHDDHAETKHDDHDHGKKADAKHDDHDHEEHADAHEGHDHGSFNPHVWLDPLNAKAFVHEIEETLVEADPENADTYKVNAEAVSKRLDDLVVEVKTQMDPIKENGFIVFHDAYHNFENRFGLSAVGSITVSPEVLPGAERVKELKAKVKNLSASCVFSEPQFEPKLVKTVTEGTQAKTGILDPLGTAIENGPELYFTLIREMAVSFKNCLSESS